MLAAAAVMLAACGPSGGSASRGEWRDADDAPDEMDGASEPDSHPDAIDLTAADCRPVEDSAFISRLCYIRPSAQVVATLRGRNYLLCNMSQGQFFDWLAAPSKGRFFNEEVKGRHDCRP